MLFYYKVHARQKIGSQTGLLFVWSLHIPHVYCVFSAGILFSNLLPKDVHVGWIGVSPLSLSE